MTGQPSSRRRYPKPDRTQPHPEVLIARGELSMNDKKLVGGILKHFGLESKFMTPEAYDEYLKSQAPVMYEVAAPRQVAEPLKFSDITSPDQYVVREHFRDFQANHPNLERRMVMRAFVEYVDYFGSASYVRNGGEYRKAEPMKGIIVRPRHEVGFPPYDPEIGGNIERPRSRTGLAAQYAIQAGSIPVATETFVASRAEIFPLSGVSSIQVMKAIADTLQSQFSSTS